MTDQQISALINTLRFTNTITSLQKDILDTWNELQKKPFDFESAYNRIRNNNFCYPDVFTAISLMPNTVFKSVETLTQDDMIFTLNCQLKGLVAKEIMLQSNGNRF